MTKPVDLIVANHMHDVVSGATAKYDMIKRMLGKKSMPMSLDDVFSHGADEIARDLLSRIAEHADMKQIYAALKAAGAPDSKEMIGEGIQAVRDRKEVS